MAKKALCIGINAYPASVGQLAGCVNDAHDWSATLTNRGFAVTKLLDAEASRAGMLEALQKLIGEAKKGDTVVITYSGHGTWVPDESGDEKDGRDEGWCPHDLTSAGAILDDDIHTLFASRAPGVRILLISDSCHSGSVTRGDESDLDPGLPRARFVAPAAWMDPAALVGVTKRPATLASGMARTGGDLLLSGCTDTEFSWDTSFRGRPNGAFTYYALKVLAGLPATATYEQWFKAVRDYLPSSNLPQNPQIFGSRGTRKFKIFE